MLYKILFIFAFSALVLGKEAIEVDDGKDLPKHNPDIVQIRRYAGMDAAGVQRSSYMCDIEETYSYFDLKNGQTPAETYMAISEENITGLKVGRDKTPEEISEFNKCSGLAHLRDEQDLIAYYANFIDQIDILPSLTFQISNGPKFQWGKRYIGDELYKQKRILNGNCQYVYEKFWDSVYHNGVVDESCIPEDFSNIPGYDNWGSDPIPQGTPPRVEKCEDGGQFNPKYKGYGQGLIINGNITTLKEAITKYGPVLITRAYYAKEDINQPDGFIHYNKDISNLLLIGWDTAGFITIVTETEKYGKVKGTFPFEGTFMEVERNEQGQYIDVEKEYDNLFIERAEFFTQTEEIIYKQDEEEYYESIPEIYEEDIPETNPDIVTIIKSETYDDEGVQIYTETCEYDNSGVEVDLTDVETADTYEAIPVDKILDLKASRDLTKEDIAEYDKCTNLKYARNIAELFSYIAYYVDQSDIYTSLTYLFSNGPKYWWIRTNIDGTDYNVKEVQDYNCQHDHEEFWSTVFNKGIVDEHCIPNNFSYIPGYDDQPGEGTAPKFPDACVNSEVEFDPKLKGYNAGYTRNGNATTFKKIITKYGPLRVISGGEYKKLQSDGSYETVGYFGRSIFIGWDTEGFITVEDEEEYDPISDELISIKKKIGKIPFVGEVDSEPYDLITIYQLWFFTPIEGYFPIDCTDVSGKTTGQCPCKDEDIRPDCQTGVVPGKCDKITVETLKEECPCPTQAEELEKDPRKGTICKPSTEQEAAGSARAVLSVVLAFVVLPALALYL